MGQYIVQFEKDKRLLVIQPLVGIGDMIWHKPWLDQLIEEYDVILATKPASQPHILFHDSLSPAQILPIHRKLRGKKGRHDGVFGLWRLASDFRAKGASAALILHHSAFYARAARLAGISHIGGFGFGALPKSVTTSLAPEDKGLHSLEKMPKFWSLNGWPAPTHGWQLPVAPEKAAAADAFYQALGVSPQSSLILGIGAMHEDRLWPSERFVHVITMMRETRPDLTPIIMGGPAERKIADEIQSHLATPVAECFTALDVAIAVLAQSGGYVGNDTSLLNLAATLQRPALGLFSQSAPLTYVDCLHHLDVIAASDYGTPGIIRQIEPHHVMAGVNKIWPNQDAVE